MRLYELNYLISGKVPEKEVPALVKKVESFLEKEGAEIEKINTSELIELAYTIKDQDRAFLATIIFNFEAEKINDLIKLIKKEDQILRHLIFKKKIIEEESKTDNDKTEGGEEEKKETKAELDKIEKKLEEILHE
jgi:ribosomal protein S6